MPKNTLETETNPLSNIYAVPNIPISKMREYLNLLPKEKIEQLTKTFLKGHPNANPDTITQFLASCCNLEMYDIREKEVKEYKKALDEMPTYMILDKTLDILWNYEMEKIPYISHDEKNDDFRQIWDRLDQTRRDLETIYIIDKSNIIGPFQTTDELK